MRFLIEIIADSHGDAMQLLSDARKMLKTGAKAGERQFCLGAVRLTVDDTDEVVGERGVVKAVGVLTGPMNAAEGLAHLRASHGSGDSVFHRPGSAALASEATASRFPQMRAEP